MIENDRISFERFFGHCTIDFESWEEKTEEQKGKSFWLLWMVFAGVVNLFP